MHRPADCKFLNYEGEIAVVISRPMRNVKPGDVWDFVAGFMPSNDVGLHDFRDTDAGSMLRVKGQDGYCPVGPRAASAASTSASRRCAPTSMARSSRRIRSAT